MLNFFAITLLLFSQGTPATTATTLPLEIQVPGVETPIIPEEYVLMPGDGLLVTVSGRVTYTYGATITYDGRIAISIPYLSAGQMESAAQKETTAIIDVVNISGLTIKEARDSLVKVFSRYFKDVKVKLTLTKFHIAVVFITGEVQKPGVYYTVPIVRVSHLITRAGGLTPLGSKKNIKIFRDDTLFATVDLENFEMKGDIASNPLIKSGDRINVPPRIGSVIVKGAVFGRGEYQIRYAALTVERERVSEGIYEWSPGERVSTMIEKAGGLAPWADLEAAYLERKGERTEEKVRIPLKLSEIIKNPNSPFNIELRDGDAIVVPSINSEVYVQGEVNSPKAYTFFPNSRASDYIGKAGGFTIFANTRRARIIRGNKKISLKGDPLIEPGDKIYVPRISVKWWQDYVAILTSLTPFAASVAYLLVAR